MPLNANALTTLANVKTELGITGSADDAYLESQINFVSTAIETFLGRTLGYEAGKVEKVKGYGGTRIRLSLIPLIEVTDVTIVNATGVTATYEVADMEIEYDGKEGFLFFRSGWPWTAPRPFGTIARDPLPGHEESSIQVTYNGGYVLPADLPAVDPQIALPIDIERAAILAVSTNYARRSADRSVKTERLMSYSVTYQDSSVSSSGSFPVSPFNAEVTAMLMPYRCIPGA